MTEEIKNLIAKINAEGLQQAQEKARIVEQQAQEEAEEILRKAKKEAEIIFAEAREKIAKMEEKQKTLLAQAGRDFLLSLRKEINAMLERILVSDMRSTLNAEALYKLIHDLIKLQGAQEKEGVVVTLAKEDLESLQKHYLHKLKEETKKVITLKSAQDIRAGFTISFDAGKSCYDFSDKALAEYIGQYLKPKLNEILKSAAA